MGFQELHREDVLGTDQVREVLLQVGDGPNLVQLLEPLSAESPVAKQIEKNGGRGGLAHVALRVADAQKAFDHLKANGFKLIDKAPRKGSRGTTVFFVHPKTTEAVSFGYLLEVVQEGCTCLTQAPGTEALDLAQEFPPVPTAAWEAAIAKDLKGADYEKKLVWRTEEGMAVRPYYRSERPGRSGAAAARPPAQLARSPRTARPGPDAVRADLLHEAGAHAVQELGYALAAGVERLAELAGTQPVETAAPRDRVRLRGRPDLLHRDRQAARGPAALGPGGAGLRRPARPTPAGCACTCAPRAATRASSTATPTCCGSPPRPCRR